MSNDQQPPQSPQQLLAKKDEKATDLTPFVPLVEKWIEGQSEEARLSHDIEKEELAVLRQSNTYNFWLLVGIVTAVFLVAAGLIFLKDNLDAGLSVLSHVGAVITGLLAGMGLERVRRRSSDE